MKISFVIPLHDEEKNASRVLKRVIKYGKRKKWDFEVIPVDDKSTDNTGKILREKAKKESLIRPIFRKSKDEEVGNTMGKALIEGTIYAKGEIIIWTMGDLADQTKTYGDIVEKLESGYDLVFGSRYMMGGSSGNLDVIKAFLSSWGTILARILFGIPVHDITNAFRGFKKNKFLRLKLQSSGFSISPEFAVKAHLAGFKLGEVPTVYTNRIVGVSSFKLINMTKSYLRLYATLFWRYKLINRIGKRKYDFILGVAGSK